METGNCKCSEDFRSQLADSRVKRQSTVHFRHVRLILAVSDLGPDDLVIVLISGGDSALMTLPADGMPVIVATQMPDSLITAHADARGGLGR